jgi:translocation and assembly module TamB
VGTVAAGWWAWRFVKTQLAPLVSENLSELFDRPVEVGPVQGVGLTQLTFGESTIPPTATDPDRATIETVEVRFNLLELLWDRTLSLDVTLVRPDIYIAQDADGLWITTELQTDDDEQENLITIELDTLRIQAGTAQLAAYGEVETSQPVDPDVEPGEEPRAEPQPEDAPATLPREQSINTIVGLTNLNGEVTFRNDNRLIVYDAAANPDTGGRLRVQGTTNLDAEQTTLQVDSRDLLAADVNLLVPLPLRLQMGRLASDLEVVFLPDDQPLQFNGTVRLRDVVAQLEGAPKPFEQVNGGLRFQGQKIAFQDFQGRYGAIPARVSGSLDTQAGYDLRVQVPSASVDQILSTVDVEAADLPIELAGVFQADARLGGAIDQPLITGTVRNIEPVLVDRLRFARTEGAFRVTPQAVLIENFRANPVEGGTITADGTVKLGEQGGVVVDIQSNDLPGDAIARTYGANTENFTIGRVDVTAQVLGRLENVQTLIEWQAPAATYPGQGEIFIAGSNIRFEETSLLVADGIVRGRGEINNGRWQAFIDTAGIRLNQFSQDLRGVLSGSFQLAGSLDNLDPAAIQAEGQVRFSEGLALIEEPLEASVRWLGDRLQILQATAPGFRGDGFILTRLQGEGAPAIENLDLNVDVSGYRLADLPFTLPEQIRVAGTTDFSGRVTGPLDAITVAGTLGLNNFAVNTFNFEQRLAGELRYALNRGLSLDVAGQEDRIFVELDERNLPRQFEIRQAGAIASGIRRGDILTADLTNFQLAALNLTPAANAGLGQVSGLVNGTVEVNLADLGNPAIIGSVTVTRPAIGYLGFNPYPGQNYLQADLFSGRFRYINGVAVLERGAELRWGDSSYLISGSFAPGADPQFQAEILTADGCITAPDRCEGLDPYVAYDGRIENILAVLRWYELSDLGEVPPPPYGTAADVETVAVGQLTAAQPSLINQLRRYSEINALYRQQVIAREGESPLPDVSSLQGAFTGGIRLAFSQSTGAAVEFNLYGRDWQWGSCQKFSPYATFEPQTLPEAALVRCQKYQVNQVIAEGGFRDQILTLRPVRLQSGDSLLSFTGTYSFAEDADPDTANTIQVLANDIPVAALRDLFQRQFGGNPIALEGNLDANATLGGNLENPQFTGEIAFREGRVNQTDAPPVTLFFGYTNARLDFFTRITDPAPEAPVSTVAEAPPPTPEPPREVIPESTPAPSPAPNPDDQFQFVGSIPYQLPFATVEPDDDAFSVNLAVSGDRLRLINLLTDQVEWKGGEQGEVTLAVRGNLPDGRINPQTLVTQGTAEFVNARIGAQALPQDEDLVIEQANILFNIDRVQVETLTGRFGTGTVRAAGVLPLQAALDPNDQTVTPLRIALQNLDIELADLYDGRVPTANIEIGGTAFAPAISGNIILSDGRVLIPTGAEEPVAAAAPVPTPANPFTIRFDALRLELGDRLRVVYDPVLNFLARGSLVVTGTQADPLLDGTVRLRSGQINLFTTQFNLARGYPNTAQFRSERGLDPLLDVRLVTSVPEVTRFPNQTNTPFQASEIADTPAAGDFGAVQTVRIQATATGPASQVFNNLELTSSPSRSETEILALLGGGFIGNVQGNATAAIASIAGSPILTGLQNLINDTLGISDFRLFPTTVLSEDARTTNLALAAELGVDLTANGDLSASVLQLLTVPASPLFSLRYRITDELLIRGSANLEGESRAVLEFETRF